MLQLHQLYTVGPGPQSRVTRLLTLGSEKDYLDAVVNHGYEHMQTAKAKQRLDTAVRNFELTTGLVWPFKDEE